MATILDLITIGGIKVLVVDSDPAAGGGTAAPRGTLAVYDNGSLATLYFKRSTTDTGWDTVDLQESVDWTEVGNALSGASSSAPNEFFGSTNDYDVLFKRNGSETMRLQGTDFLIGLTASLGGRLQVGATALGDEILRQTSPNGGSGSRVIRVTRQYKVQTTDDTQTVLAAIALPSDSRMMIKAYVGARQHAGTAGVVGDGAAYEKTVDAKNTAGATSIVTNQSDFTSEDSNPAFDLDVSASGANAQLLVTGAIDRSIAWSGHIEISIYVD